MLLRVLSKFILSVAVAYSAPLFGQGLPVAYALVGTVRELPAKPVVIEDWADGSSVAKRPMLVEVTSSVPALLAGYRLQIWYSKPPQIEGRTIAVGDRIAFTISSHYDPGDLSWEHLVSRRWAN